LVVPGWIVGWHEPQSVLVGCGAGGGKPWQVPHAFCVPSSCVHVGVFSVPPASVGPWQ
jgi:hypothetical protein